MMADGAKGRAYAGQILDQAFFGRTLPWQKADAFHITLHTADPQGPAGELLAEVDYLGYATLEIGRTAADWTRTGETVSNRRDLRFPTCDEAQPGEVVATHWAIRPQDDATIVWCGPLSAPLRIVAMVRPVIDAGGIEISES